MEERLVRSLVAILVCFVWNGCSGPSSPYPMARLEGQVTIDGRPVAQGRILFISQGGGQSRPTQATIAAGRYAAADVPLGKVLVRLIATEKTGKTIPIPDSDDEIEEVVDLVPAQYAQGIPIEVEGDNLKQDFSLTSQ